MTTRYESAFILQPTLTGDEIKQKVELIKETLVKLKADIKAVDEMGMRELAYKIKKFERGYYVILYFSVEPSAIKELERVYRINEEIIRFLTFKYTKEVEVKVWEKMIAKATRKSADKAETKGE